MRLRYAIYTLALGVLAVHFVLTLIYVSPPNPIKTLTNLPQKYVGRFFYQDWGLFAPNPISMDIRVLVSCLADGYDPTPPLDINRGFLERRYLNGYDRVNRVAANYAYSRITLYRSQMPYTKLCTQTPDHPDCNVFRFTDEERKNAAEEGLRRVASAFCADISKAKSIKYEKAHLWIILSEVPRWSKRHTEGRKESVLDLGVVKLEESRAFGIWRYGGGYE